MQRFDKIIVVGDGWGAVAVLKGLEKFSLPVYVISSDPDVLSLSSKLIPSNLESLSGNLVLFAGYKPIVPTLVLQKNTCINIHYSLLPTYRGLHSTVWAILNNESHLGMTIHLMNEYIDDGPILYQYSIENDYKTNACEYMQLFNNHVTSVIGSVLLDFIQSKITPITQDKSKASWVGKRTEKDCQIDFSRPIKYQKAFFRALVAPYPLPYFIHKANKYIVSSVDYQPSNVETHIGRILNIDNEGIWVKCADGYIILKEIRDVEGSVVSYSNFRIGQYINN